MRGRPGRPGYPLPMPGRFPDPRTVAASVVAATCLWAVPVPAHSDMPPASYRESLCSAAWFSVNNHIEAAKVAHQEEDRVDHLETAIKEAAAFQKDVAACAGVQHLMCESFRRLDKSAEAERACRASVQLDRDYSAPWYDLGELMFAAGRYDEARAAFLEVQRLETSGPQAMIGPWRLAEVAAAQSDPERFEEHTREALRRGFTFRDVTCHPNWRTYHADPMLRDSVEKLITVYGDPQTLVRLRDGTGCP